MAKSPYFNSYSNRNITPEQLLVEDLLNEAIRIHGTDVYYIIRESEDEFDPLFGEDPLAYFQRAHAIDMYIVDVESYRGDGEFLSKFGLEARQGANFLVTRRAWNRYIPPGYADRPREGDLIWVPVFGKIFEIKFVDKDKNFYQLGKKDAYFYELYTELWKFGENRVDTGIEDIDRRLVDDTYTIRLSLNVPAGSTQDYIEDEKVYQGGSNVATSSASATVAYWDRPSGNLDVIHIKGEFNSSAGQNVIGASSNTSYSIVTPYDPQENYVFYEYHDNKLLQLEANLIINSAETNPFGRP
jgi:hypothetical protein